MSTSANLALPLCDCIVSRNIFEALPKYVCRHNFHYDRANVLEYNEVIGSMATLDRRAAELEDSAQTIHNERVGTAPQAAVATEKVMRWSPNTGEYVWTEEPIGASGSVAAGTTTSVSSAQIGSKAPIATKSKSSAPERARGQRSIPKLTPQQTLLAVAAGLVVIALSVFFTTSWQSFNTLGKAGVVVLLVASTAVGSIWSKKYFTIISNFLAGLSALFLGAGLWAASAMELLPADWANPSTSPYLSAVLTVVAAYGLLLGRRFKIFGWLATAPIALTAGLLLFIAVTSQNLFGGFSQSATSLDAIRSLLAAVAIFASIAVGRLTRFELTNFAVSKKSSKKLTKDEADAKAEQDYLVDLHKREQSALRFTYRSTAAVLFAYSAWAFVQVAIALFGSANVASVSELIAVVPTPLVLVPLAAFWWFAARFTSGTRAEEWLGAEIKNWVPRVAWIYTAVVTAIALSSLSLITTAMITASLSLTPVGALISVAIGAVLLFLPGAKFFEKNQAALIPIRLAAMASWLLWLGLQQSLSERQLVLALWLGLISIVTAVKSFTARDARYAHAHYILAALATILFALRASELFWWPSAAVGLCLAITVVSVAAYSWLLQRAGFESRLISMVVQPVVSVATLVTIDAWGVDVNVTTAIAIAYLALNVFISVSKKFSKVGFAPIVSALAVSVLCYVELGLFDSASDQMSTIRLVIFAIASFGLNLLHAVRSKISVSGLAAYLPLAILAVSTEKLLSPYLQNVIGFAPVVGFALVLGGHWLVSTRVSKPHQLISAIATSAYSIVLINSLRALQDGTLASLVEPGYISVPLTLCVLSYVAFGLALQMIRMRRGELKYFDSKFVIVTGLSSLGVALLISFSTLATSALVLQVISLAAVSLLVFVAIGSAQEVARVRLWSYAALLIIPLTAAHVLNTVLFGFNLFSGSFSLINAIAVPLNILLAALSLRLIGARIVHAGVKLGWWIRPLGAGVGAVAGLVAPFTIGLYAPSIFPYPLFIEVLIYDLVAYLIVGTVFTVFRVRDFEHTDTQRGLLANTLLTFGFGVFAVQSDYFKLWLTTLNGYTWPGFMDSANLVLPILMLGFAAMLLIVAYLKRDSLSVYIGYALALFGSELLITNTWKVDSLHVMQLFVFAAIASYLLANALLRRTSAVVTSVWGWVLPVTTALANLYAIVSAPDVPMANGWIDFTIATALGWLYVLAVVTPRLSLFGTAKASLLASSAVSWLVAGCLSTFTNSEAMYLQLGLLFSIIWLSMVTLLRASKTLLVVGVGYASLAIAALAFANYAQTFGIKVSDGGPEVFAVLVAASFVINGRVLARTELLNARLRSVVLHGLPLLTVGLPSAITALTYAAAPITALPAASQLRLAALLVLGALGLFLGLRRGNLGVTVASSVAFGLTLLPEIWFRIEEFLQGKLQSEIKFAYIAILIYAALSGLQSVIKFRANSILILGLPIGVALVPALYDTVTALDASVMTGEDWARFLIVLSGSLVILILGALRKIAGFFVPGVVGVAVAAVPYLWKPLSQQQWFLWVVLVLVAALLVWVAIRLEQFKTGVRSAGAWLRELK